MSAFIPRLRASLRSSALRTPAPAPSSTPFPRPRFSSTRATSAANPTTNRGQNASRARPFIYVLGLMPIVCFGLGTWQVRRLQWKLDMIDQLEAKLNQDTVRLPARIEYVLLSRSEQGDR